MPTDNPWQLYSTTPGWEGCAAALTDALTTQLAALDRMVAPDQPVPVPVSLAAHASFNAVLKVMERKDYQRFGATDSEPRSYLAWAITRHIRNKHASRLYVDRFGDVTE